MTGYLERLRERARDAAHDDAGFTMLEMVVGMVLMTIFLAIFTGAIVAIFSSTNKAVAVDDSSDQLNQAFQRLDTQVRYASYVSTPGISADHNWYVEFQTTNTGTPVCTQLRVNTATRVLQERTWTVVNSAPNTSATALSAWTALASNVTNGSAVAGATQPFTVAAASANINSQRLTVYLIAASGNGSTATTSNTSITFTAVNSTLIPPQSATCGEVARS